MSKKATSSLSKVLLTDRAVSDLLGIKSYSVETFGAAIANRYLLKFEKAFKLIATNPDLLIPNPLLHESLLFFRVEKHLLSCIKIKLGVAVLTITHTSRDLPALLHELSPTLNREVTVLMSRIELN